MFVFISHAREDKDEVARPLAAELKKLGVDVWYDEYSLSLGDSLHEKIEEGLAKCRFGIVILSESFFNKNWPKKELGGLFARHSQENRVIIPIWHKIDADYLVNNYPMLADIYATNTNKGINIVAREISNEIKKNNDNYLDISNWISAQHILFPCGIPTRSEWSAPDDIINTLNIICLPALNHMFFPGGGGLDLESARISFEQGFIELNHLTLKMHIYDDPNPLELEERHSAILLKPKKLSFHSFPPHFEMSYFWLECEDIPPLQDFPTYGKHYQECVEFNGHGNYYDINFWHEGEYYNSDTDEYVSIPKDSRRITRFINGKFVVFAKRSFYNHLTSTYDGRQNIFSEDEFRIYIEHMIITLVKKEMKLYF